MKTIAQILDEDTQSHAERFQKMADAHAKLMNHHDKLAVNHTKAGRSVKATKHFEIAANHDAASHIYSQASKHGDKAGRRLANAMEVARSAHKFASDAMKANRIEA